MFLFQIEKHVGEAKGETETKGREPAISSVRNAVETALSKIRLKNFDAKGTLDRSPDWGEDTFMVTIRNFKGDKDQIYTSFAYLLHDAVASLGYSLNGESVGLEGGTLTMGFSYQK